MNIPNRILRSFILPILISQINADPVRVPPSDSNLINGLSPLNWVTKKEFVCASVAGASINLKFMNTKNLTLLTDPSHLNIKGASRFPIISWSVNNGSYTDFQLTKETTSIPLTSGIQDPAIDLYLKGFSPFENRYKGDCPGNSVKISAFEIDSGGRTAATALPPKVWMNIGNSIESGDAALYKEGQGRPPNNGWSASSDGRASYGYLLAKHFGYRETRIATGGYNWKGGLAGMPRLTILMDNVTSTFSRLKDGAFHPMPGIVLINLGENGTPSQGDVTSSLTQLRSRVDQSVKIIVMIPVSGKGRAAITGAVKLYKSDSADKEVYLVDLGDIKFATADGQHPTSGGHEEIFKMALPYFEQILPKTALANILPHTRNRIPAGRIYINATSPFPILNARISYKTGGKIFDLNGRKKSFSDIACLPHSPVPFSGITSGAYFIQPFDANTKASK